MVTRLVTQDVELTLSEDKSGWCEVDVSLRGRTVHLGADQQQIVAKRLALALEEELKGDVVGVINGMNVVWVLSLSEAHATIFVADAIGRRVLFSKTRLALCLETRPLLTRIACSG